MRQDPPSLSVCFQGIECKMYIFLSAQSLHHFYGLTQKVRCFAVIISSLFRSCSLGYYEPEKKIPQNQQGLHPHA